MERLWVVDQPFAHSGVDYFGPLLVEFKKKNQANQAVAERYGAIFRCLSSCVLHIELAGDLSTDSFILALRRFISRRGYPKSIISDNSTNFVGAQWELSEALWKLDHSRIKDDLIFLWLRSISYRSQSIDLLDWFLYDISLQREGLNQRHIIWKFNPPCAPWMGGAPWIPWLK